MTATPRISPSGPVLTIPPSGMFAPLFQQFYVDTTKDPGGNGSIGTPFNTWADAMNQLDGQGALFPWIIYLANDLDAIGTPVPNFVGGGHDSPYVKFQGVVQNSVFSVFGTGLDNVAFNSQDTGRLTVEFDDLLVAGVTFPNMVVTIVGSDSLISNVSESGGAVIGSSRLINCTVNLFNLPSWDLGMVGGTVDLSMTIQNGTLDDVEFLDSVQLRWSGSLNLTNCRFRAGGQLLCAANQQLNLDLDTWGSMIAAGITFPDTFPTMVITPWVPIMGQVLKAGNTTCTSGGVTTVNAGTIAPQEAEKSTVCIASFGNTQNSKLIVVGASINASRELEVLVSNVDVVDHDLVDVLFTVTYLPRLSP